jgi:Ssp1 endopeptidase immunity protein Rap1a
LKLLGALFIAALVSAPAQAGEKERSVWTGNNLINACRESTTGSTKTSAFEQGICLGAVFGLMGAGRHMKPELSFCPPPNASVAQGTRVVVKYMEAHPEQLHSTLNVLIADALQEAWPCPSQG